MESSDSHSGAGDDDAVFTCQECGQTVSVNASMKQALKENGCVMCGADVVDSAFECS